MDGRSGRASAGDRDRGIALSRLNWLSGAGLAMIPGLNTFEAVLDRLGRQATDASLSGSATWARIRGLNAGFIGASEARGRPDSEQIRAAYLDNSHEMPAAPPEPEPEIDVSMYARLSADEVARDLDLLGSDTRPELQLKRRKFARTNHPDRAPEEWRDAATTRMKIANRLIDDAVRKAVAKQA